MKLIPERLRRRRRDRGGTMTLVEHLEELRYRLMVALGAIAVGSLVGWFLFDGVVDLLLNPYCDYWETVPARVRPTSECTLFYSGALEPALIKFKLVGFLGLFIALPVVLYQLWRFIVPGLTDRERKLAIPFVVSSVLLFALGAAFAYWTLPKALGLLLGVGGPPAPGPPRRPRGSWGGSPAHNSPPPPGGVGSFFLGSPANPRGKAEGLR